METPLQSRQSSLHLHITIKMVATVAKGEQSLSKRRARLAGPSGVKGLIYNFRIFSIAVFASLGGFVYGCMTRPLLETKKTRQTN